MISWLLLSASLFLSNPSDELKLHAQNVKHCLFVEDTIQCEDRPTIVDVYLSHQSLIFEQNQERLEYLITESVELNLGVQYRIVDLTGEEIYALVEPGKVSLFRALNAPAYLTYY